METRKLPEEKERVETGPIQFGNDWPGVFIRGDNAFHYSITLEEVIKKCDSDPISLSVIHSLIRLLSSCVKR